MDQAQVQSLLIDYEEAVVELREAHKNAEMQKASARDAQHFDDSRVIFAAAKRAYYEAVLETS